MCKLTVCVVCKLTVCIVCKMTVCVVCKMTVCIVCKMLKQGISDAGFIPVGVTGCKDKRVQNLASEFRQVTARVIIR